ncbi:MAG: rod shape-determining protein RodA [Bacteroidota bacterium]
MSRRAGNSTEIDWILVFLYFGLVLTGLLMIYSVSSSETHPSLFDFDVRQGSQLIWIVISMIAGLVIMIVDHKFYRSFSYVIYVGILLLLVGVLFFGQEVAGSRSWFNLGFFKFQPAEFAKFATCLALANYLSGYNVTLQTNRSRLTAMGIVFVPMGLILLQGDAGSALVFASLMIVLFREGMPALLYLAVGIIGALSILALVFDWVPVLVILLTLAILALSFGQKGRKTLSAVFGLAAAVATWQLIGTPFLWYAIGGLGAVILVLFIINLRQKNSSFAYLVTVGLLISIGYSTLVNYGFNTVLKPHQQDRINVWLRPSKCEPLGSLYNLNQSKLAIGTGGLTGKGFGNGPMTQMEYVPEQPTDFIFCTIGEEQGFAGSLGFIVWYLLMLIRIIEIGERQRSKFSRLYAYGVASILFFHFMVNVGMTIGLMPVIGIPLPFISYGGSSLLSFTILLAILIKLDSARLASF